MPSRYLRTFLPVLRVHQKQYAGPVRLFVSRDGSPLRGNTLYQAFVRARRRIGREDLTIHEPGVVTIAGKLGADLPVGTERSILKQAGQ